MNSWLLSALIGCPSEPPEKAPKTHPHPPLEDTSSEILPPDADGDGATADIDCDDLDPERFPGAVERCDGKDNDCDGSIDEGAVDAQQVWPDADEDGFGDDIQPSQAVCFPDSNTSPIAGDCDDTDPNRYPGAFDLCDGVDQDCDEQIDEDIEWVTVWPDEDGDSFGDDLAIPQTTCAPSLDTVPVAGDCDDSDELISPLALERCDSPADENCDGSADEPDADGCLLWYNDTDGDGAGSGEPSCTCSSEGSPLAGDCDDEDPTRFPGATDDCEDAVDQDCDGFDPGCGWTGEHLAGDVALARFDGPATGGTGRAVSIGGDYDGDGVTDLVLRIGETVGVLRGPLLGNVGEADVYATISGDYWQSIDFGGASLLLDADGDGIDDLVIGDPSATDPWFRAGAVYVMLGPTAGSRVVTAPDRLLESREANDSFGFALARGDANGDGIDDLLAGGPGLGLYGEAALFLGPLLDATVDDAHARLIGVADNIEIGSAVACLGDTDGDGLDDFIIGDRYAALPELFRGAAYVWLGPTTTTNAELADAVITGAQTEQLGDEVAGADIDGDGYADAVVSATQDGTLATYGGAVFVFSGPVLGNLDKTMATGAVYGTDIWLEIGHRIGAGDLNDDGAADLVISHFNETSVMIEEGAVHLVAGPTIGSSDLMSASEAIFRGSVERGAVGITLAVGDATGDGLDDLWFGANKSELFPGSASVYLVPGL